MNHNLPNEVVFEKPEEIVVEEKSVLDQLDFTTIPTAKEIVKRITLEYSDPFDLVSDEDVKFAHIASQRKMLFDDICKHISRGQYSVQWLIDRFSNDLFPPEEIAKLIKEAKDQVLRHFGSFNPQMEVVSYLATISELKETLFEMLDANKGKPRIVLEITKTIAALDSQRLDFSKFVGLAVRLKTTGQETLNNDLPAEDMQFIALLEDADAIEHRLSGGHNSGNTKHTGEVESSRVIEGKVEIK